VTALLKLLAFVLAVAAVPARATVAGLTFNVPLLAVIVLAAAATAGLWLAVRHVLRYPLRPADWRWA
jgi:hypothetical protein